MNDNNVTRQEMLDAGLIRPSPAYGDSLTPYRGTQGKATLLLAGSPVFCDAPSRDYGDAFHNHHMLGLPAISAAAAKPIDREVAP